MADFRTPYARHLSPSIRAALADTRVVAILGPRQAGKSTLARSMLLPGADYRTFDDLATRDSALSDPAGFARALPPGSVIDEVQRVPDILLAIKAIVDNDPTPGRFILTGSANLLTLPTISESLAGRIELFTLLPLAQSEIAAVPSSFVDALFAKDLPAVRPTRGVDYPERITSGGFPEALRRRDASRRHPWFESYVTTILHRDVRDVSAIADIGGMERLLRLSAARTASLLNETSLASEVGIPRRTVNRYLDVLEHLYLAWRLPAYTVERGRRLSRAPKIHIVDTGLATNLIDADEALLTDERNLLGGLLETFVINEIRAQAAWSVARPKLFHYREYDGREIDCILERRSGELVAIEVKATTSPGESDFRAMRRFAEDRGETLVRGVVFYTGVQTLPFGDGFVAVPISRLWE